MTTFWLVWQVVCWVWHTAITLAVWWVLLSVCLKAWLIVAEQEGNPEKHSWRMLWRHWWAGEVRLAMRRDDLPRWAAETIVKYDLIMDALRAPYEFALCLLDLAADVRDRDMIGGD